MTQQSNAYFIKWDVQNSSSYLYGTVLKQLDAGKVFYKNQYIPSGTVLYKWISRVHFQSERYTNNLPRLERGKKYRLSYSITTHPQNATYLKVDVKDIMQDVIETFIVKQGEVTEFEISNKLHSYTIELISSGVESLVFDQLLLQDSQAKAYTVDKYWIDNRSSHQPDCLHVVFTEPFGESLAIIDEDVIQKLEDVVVVNSSYKTGLLYAHKSIISAIDNLIKEYNPNQVVCIGYGPVSNFAALYYADRYEKGFAKVTDDWWRANDYRDVLENDLVGAIRVKDLLFEQYNSRKVVRTIINAQGVDSSALSFLNPTYRLKQLLNSEDRDEYESIKYECN